MTDKKNSPAASNTIDLSAWGLTVTGLVTGKNVFEGDKDNRYSLDISAPGLSGALSVTVPHELFAKTPQGSVVTIPLSMRIYNNRTYFGVDDQAS